MRKLFTIILLALLCANAMAYDFSAVCSTGQTLYYNITSYVEPYTVKVTSEHTENPYYTTYPEGDLVIPESVEYNGIIYSVTGIGYIAFNNCSGLTSVTIPNSVTSIDEDAFFYCSGLTSVTIPNSVTSIHRYAFLGTGWYDNQSDGVLYLSGWCLGYKGSRPTGSLEIQQGTIGFASYAFSECSELTSVTIPNSIIYVNANAFSGCIGITEPIYSENIFVYFPNGYATEYTIPNGISYIADEAFYGCNRLTSVTIPNSITSIGSRAFYNCYGLLSFTIPNTVVSIGNNAFYHVKNIVYQGTATSNLLIGTVYSWGELTHNGFVEDNLVYLDESKTQLTGCSILATEVTIPSSVTGIGTYAFQGCNNLTSFLIPSCVTSIGSSAFLETGWYNNQSDGILYLDNWCLGYKGDRPTGDLTIVDGTLGIVNNAFGSCSELTSITIPNSVTSIGSYAFEGCTGLTSITIPNSVTSIGSGAFSNCSGLTSITIPNSVMSIGSEAFYSCSGLTEVTIPISVVEIGIAAFNDCSGLTTVNFNATNSTVRGSLFMRCTSLSTLNIGENVTNIPDYAFSNCSGLTSLTIPNSVTSIGRSAFESCSGLTSVTIGNSVTSIGEDAFMICSGLTSVTIGNSVTSIGWGAFSYCSGLTSVTIPNSVVSISDAAFYGCDGLTSVYYTSDIAGWCRISFDEWCSNPLEFAHNLYINNSLVTELDIPESVTEIKANAFNGAACLTSLTIPNSVTSIGESAFEECSGLTSVTIGNSVTSIGEYAFAGCEGLISVTIPNSVTDIGEVAFGGCSGLTSLIIGNSVENIGDGAFGDCDSLAEIHIKASVPPVLGEYVFGYYDDENDTTIYNTTATLWTPCGVEDSYRNDSEWGRFRDIRSDIPSISIDTTVNNFVTIGDHTFYSTGNYRFAIPVEIGCDTIVDLQLRVLAEPVYYIGPNPTKSLLNINSDGFISAVEFYSVTGQFVMRKEVNGYEAEFDMEGLVDGVYILRIYGEESSLPSISKIIKE